MWEFAEFAGAIQKHQINQSKRKKFKKKKYDKYLNSEKEPKTRMQARQ
jgi:hypothetical protein